MGKRQSQDNYSCKVFLPTSFSKEVGESLDFFIAKEYYTHMRKIAAFIVKKSVLFFIIFAALVAYGIYGITKVRVEYDITGYLPSDTDTAQALVIMNEEFATYGSATVMVKNVDRDTAEKLAADISKIDGISGFSFDAESAANYKDGNALYSMFFAGGSGDEKAVAAYNALVALLDGSGCEYVVPTPLVNSYADTLASEMVIILIIAAVVIAAVLLFTSKSFAEVLAFPIVFVVAAILNMGTNYWLGKISFVSNTVCIILQLALAIDYAIILSHRFTEEKEKTSGDPQAALINALAKAIPEIASSSLTTVSGLVALMFMQLRLGFDLGMVLAKSIICSLLTVFLLMPGLLRLLSRLMDKSRHRNFVPKVRFLGRGVVKARYVVIAAFVALFAVGAGLSQTVTYCYSQNSIDTSRPTAAMEAKREMSEVFGESNAFVILVPSTADFDTQRKITAAVQSEPLITSALGWASLALPSDAPDKTYYIADGTVTAAELSGAIGISPFLAIMLFDMYAQNAGENMADISTYRVPIIDLLEFAFASDTVMNMAGDGIAKYKDVLEFGKQQLIGSGHYRMVFYMNATEEAKETFELIERLTPTVKEICGEAIFAGSSMSAYDLNASFMHDNILITILTVAFIYLILAVTFKSFGIPLVLVLVIQGAIFVNFSIPVLLGNNVFFFVYLIASAIQMGATIDYAILLTNRFRQMKTLMPKNKAVIEAVSASFPTIMTSGTIMTVASFLVGLLTSDPLISSMGMVLGTGTLISMFGVLVVLPALLYTLDAVLEKTVIKGKLKAKDIKMPNPSKPINSEWNQKL